MKRIIGIPVARSGVEKEKPKPEPKPDLPDMVAKIDTRADELEKKINLCELELKKLSTRLKSLPEGATKNSMKSKAYGILQRKKKFEEQADTLKQQSFNIAQTSGTIESTRDAGIIVKAMKAGVKELKKAQKKINVDLIEELQDELEELCSNSEEIQDVFASNLNMPVMDDQELQDQLELLGDELADDHDTSYLDAAIGGDAKKSENGEIMDSSNPSLPPDVKDLVNTAHSNDSFPPPSNSNSSNRNSLGLDVSHIEAPFFNSQWGQLPRSSKKNMPPHQRPSGRFDNSNTNQIIRNE